MQQQHKNDLSAMREILEQMRDHLERMRQDNRELKEENRQLRMMLLDDRKPNRSRRTEPSTHRPPMYPRGSLDDYSTPMPSAYDVFHEEQDVRSTMSGFGRSEFSRHESPTSVGKGITESFARHSAMPSRSELPSHEDVDVYRPRSAPRSSSYLGAGVSAQEAQARGTQPADAMPRPAMDLGFINKVSPEQLDSLPYGLVVLDTQGDVLFYNETESTLTGFARERVIGKNFFTKVAPCTQVKEFQGRFEQFVRGELGRVTFFDFAFHFEQGTQNVLIGLSHGRKRGHINVMMVRK